MNAALQFKKTGRRQCYSTVRFSRLWSNRTKVSLWLGFSYLEKTYKPKADDKQQTILPGKSQTFEIPQNHGEVPLHFKSQN